MTFVPKKFNEIFEAMRDRTTVVTDFTVGSVTRTMYESFAFEIALLYEKMHLVYLSAYVDSAEGPQLDNVVSILGIKRGLPDFAEGEVTFQRDAGKEDVAIPLGTLVATEDKPESPKKTYQTIEPKTLLKNQTSVKVKVQAVNRGEEEVVGAETVVVMPRPIPGIKAVINEAATRFTGKRREADEELRERAKNALISSGKATIISIENALLSLPEVKDVKVKENFHFARGKVMLTRTSGTGEVLIPKGTRLKAETVKAFATTEQVVLADGASSVEVTVQSLLEGKAGEVTQTGAPVAWQIEPSELASKLSASNAEPILLEEFGIIEVFVDGFDFSDPENKEKLQRLQDEIDRVRAAGIFVLLQAARPVEVDGIFKIEINPDLKLSPEERADFEMNVSAEIEKYVTDRKMGEPLLFAQIVKNTLSMESINNLEDFVVATIRKQQGGPDKKDSFGPAAKRIEIEEFERFKPRYLCVASEMKKLPVHIQFKATAALDNTKLESIRTALTGYFGGLQSLQAVQKSAIQSAIQTVIAIDVATLKLAPEPWCPREIFEGDDIDVSFVEQAELGDVFGYDKLLNLTGALKLTLPTTITEEEKQNVRTAITAAITDYLANLKSEADVVFADLIAIAAKVERVLAVDLDPDDFRVAVNGTEAIDRISKEKIEVKAFEKAQLDKFCITGGVEKIEITVAAVELKLTAPATEDEDVKDALKTAAKNVIANFLSGAKPGQDVAYASLKNALQNLVSGASYNVAQLTLTAASACDGRTQMTDIGIAKDIHVRSVEISVMKPFDDTKLTISGP